MSAATVSNVRPDKTRKNALSPAALVAFKLAPAPIKTETALVLPSPAARSRGVFPSSSRYSMSAFASTAAARRQAAVDRADKCRDRDRHPGQQRWLRLPTRRTAHGRLLREQGARCILLERSRARAQRERRELHGFVPGAHGFLFRRAVRSRSDNPLQASASMTPRRALVHVRSARILVKMPIAAILLAYPSTFP